MNRLIMIALAAMIVAGCGGEKGGVDIHLDSAGNKIGEVGKKVGAKLDTAFHDIKTDLNEAQIESGLHRMRGMENVQLDLTDSTARLYGWVASEADRAFAGEVIGRVNGVARVTNELAVGPSDTTRHDTSVPPSTGAK
jgi:hypothetical protein